MKKEVDSKQVLGKALRELLETSKNKRKTIEWFSKWFEVVNFGIEATGETLEKIKAQSKKDSEEYVTEIKPSDVLLWSAARATFEKNAHVFNIKRFDDETKSLVSLTFYGLNHEAKKAPKADVDALMSIVAAKKKKIAPKRR